MLEEALAEFPGTVLAVSHDRYFLRKIATRVLEIADGEVTDYTGDYECASPVPLSETNTPERELTSAWFHPFVRFPGQERGRGGAGGGGGDEGDGGGQVPDCGQEQDVTRGEGEGEKGQGKGACGGEPHTAPRVLPWLTPPTTPCTPRITGVQPTGAEQSKTERAEEQLVRAASHLGADPHLPGRCDEMPCELGAVAQSCAGAVRETQSWGSTTSFSSALVVQVVPQVILYAMLAYQLVASTANTHTFHWTLASVSMHLRGCMRR